MEVNTTQIEKLLDCYFEGNTSLEEQKLLINYFSKNTIPAHLEVYRPLFTFITQEKKLISKELQNEEQFVFEFPSTMVNTRKFKLRWVSVAASFIILLSISGVFFQNYQKQQTEAAELALSQTKQVLMKVSTEFNTGIQNLEHLQELDKTTPFFNLNNK